MCCRLCDRRGGGDGGVSLVGHFAAGRHSNSDPLLLLLYRVLHLLVVPPEEARGHVSRCAPLASSYVLKPSHCSIRVQTCYGTVSTQTYVYSNIVVDKNERRQGNNPEAELRESGFRPQEPGYVPPNKSANLHLIIKV